MLQNYFKIALRQLLRNKTFSIINILGLAVGMSAVILILLWIRSEISYDNFHSKKDRIYELWNRGEFSGKLQCWNTTPIIAGEALPKDVPEVEKTARVNWTATWLFTAGEKQIHLTGNVADQSFLDIFSFPILKGNPSTALKTGKSLVLTKEAAEKLFGTSDVIGKTVQVGNNKKDVMVTAIIATPPANTRFNFEYLLGWDYMFGDASEEAKGWDNNSVRNYVLLKPNVSVAAAQEKVKNIRKKYQPEGDQLQMFLYPMDRWRLYSSFENGSEDGGRIEYVRLFAIIAGFILLIACINFMNLSTARSEKRAREVGIRKTVGAQRTSLIGQFVGESVLLAFISFLIALCIVQLSLPAFNELVGKQLSLHFLTLSFWLFSLIFIFITGVLAGSYPAFFLSSFKPVNVLKGTFKSVNALVTPRKALVVFQFAFAIILIICTVVVKQQINYAQERESGYDKTNLIYHQLSNNLEKNYDLLKNELLSSGVAEAICKTSSPICEGWSDTWGIEWRGKSPNDKTDFDRYCTDEGLVKTMGLQLVKGRDINLKDFPTDSTAAIINESSVKAMGFKEPIGETFKDNNTEWHIVGVVKDFILHSPYQPMRPLVVVGNKLNWLNMMHIRLNSSRSTQENLRAAEVIFKKYNPGFPFEYNFIDEDYARKFENEKRTGSLAILFAGLTIFISCLGLFGLSTYMAESRIKEIGIRKVLGASVTNITRLLSINFLSLVLIAFIIASPLAWLFMRSWLSDYPYHVEMKWWVFATAGLLSILISILTISYQAIKAALTNPVKSLRTE
jgi:ABC-type antimicrobial peptide transport system permease subunit